MPRRISMAWERMSTRQIIQELLNLTHRCEFGFGLPLQDREKALREMRLGLRELEHRGIQLPLWPAEAANQGLPNK